LPEKLQYPPELVVLCTPNVSAVTQRKLDAFCTRVLQVEDLHFPTDSIDSKVPKRTPLQRKLDNHCPGLTKLRVFELQQYDTVIYVDADCLVLQDISDLLERGKVYVESEALIAAAPDVVPPDKFNSGVLVVRPNKQVFENMMGQAGLLTTCDGSDTGFLNAYYNEWFTEMPPMTRLPVGYNAQQVLHELTADRDGVSSSYWDVSVAPDLKIVHFSNATKPWETHHAESTAVTTAAAATTTAITTPSKSQSTLVTLWKSWYQKSQNYLARYLKEQYLEQEAKQQAEQKQNAKIQQQRKLAAAQQQRAANDPKHIHRLVTRRFKELRREGMPIQDAMAQAQAELQPEETTNAGDQVAAMFGMR
jgi:glycogenin glucosyltransferase